MRHRPGPGRRRAGPGRYRRDGSDGSDGAVYVRPAPSDTDGSPVSPGPAPSWSLASTWSSQVLHRPAMDVEEKESMTEDAAPGITGIHHVSATVTDVEASVAWYQRLFGMGRVPFTFRHYGQEEGSGYGVMLLDPRS